MNVDGKINYVELPARNFARTKAFYGSVFGWEFEDFGSEYIAFSKAGLEGGFYLSDLSSSTAHGAALIVFYSQNLDKTYTKIVDAEGVIIKPTFEFPGGRRFHFADPNGNEFAVWSDK